MTREDDGPRFPDDAVDISMCAEFGQRIWVGILWRADDLLFDFQTCPKYQKLPTFKNKAATATQNLCM